MNFSTRIFGSLILFFLFSSSLFAQDTIAVQNFDADTTWDYSSDVPYFSHQGTNTLNNVYPAPDGWDGDGFYGIIDSSDATGLDYPALTGNLFGERDLDDEGDFGTSGDATTSFEELDIRYYENVTLSFDYDIEGYNANSDEAFYELFYDHTSQGRDTLQTGSTPGDNAEGSVSVAVPDSLDTLSLDLILNNNGISGYSGFDNFLLEGDLMNTSVAFESSSDTVVEDAGSYDVGISIEAPASASSTSADLVLVSGDPSDLGGYSTQTVTFPAGSDTDETVNISITNNDTCDGDLDYQFELQNVTGGNSASAGTMDQFTLTVEDDESSSTATLTPSVCDSFTVPSGDTTYSSSGVYMDTIPNAVGCDSIMTIDLTVDSNRTADLNPTACESYTVPSGDTSYTSSGTYMDTIPTIAGCDSILSIDLTIGSVDTSVTDDPPTLTADASSADSYQWVDCSDNSPIQGATDQSYMATSNGDYAVIVTQDGCTDTSSCHSVTNVGIEEFGTSGEFAVYPNPVKEKLRVDLAFGKVQEQLAIELFNMQGQQLRRIELEGVKEGSHELEFGDLPQGLYFLHIRSEEGDFVRKVEKLAN